MNNLGKVENQEIKVLRNYVVVDRIVTNKSTKEVRVGKKLDQLLDEVTTVMPYNFIKVGGKAGLAIYDGETFGWVDIEDADDFEAILLKYGCVLDWDNRCSFAFRFKSLWLNFKNFKLKRYERRMKWPAYPSYTDEYVDEQPITPENNGMLSRLVDFFNPLTGDDRLLMMALAVTPGWGSKGGRKPLFVIAGPEDCPSTIQIGKSTFAEMIQRLWESHSDIVIEEAVSRLIGGLIDSARSRIIRIDNLRGGLPSGILERYITSPRIFGHKINKGHEEIDNRATWIITANMPRVTEDLASRSQVIRLSIPDKNKLFRKDNVLRFIDDNRRAILANAFYFLQKPNVETPNTFSRFPEWEIAVLRKLTENVETVAAKFERDQADLVKDTKAQDFGHYVVEMVQRYLDPWFQTSDCLLNLETYKVFATSEMIHTWFDLCFNKKSSRSSKVFAEIKRVADEAGYKGDVIKVKGRMYRGYWLSQPEKGMKILISNQYSVNKYGERF